MLVVTNSTSRAKTTARPGVHPIRARDHTTLRRLGAHMGDAVGGIMAPGVSWSYCMSDIDVVFREFPDDPDEEFTNTRCIEGINERLNDFKERAAKSEIRDVTDISERRKVRNAQITLKSEFERLVAEPRPGDEITS